MPATGAVIGTPASIRAKVPPQTVAMELEPFDSRMSLTTRIVYGNVFSPGTWPTSPAPPMRHDQFRAVRDHA